MSTSKLECLSFGLEDRKAAGTHSGLGSAYTCWVRWLRACIAIRFGEFKGIRDDDGACVVMIGASSIVARRGDHLVAGTSLIGLIMAGSWPGVLLRVCRWCTHWELFIKVGSVGLLLVVTLGASITL